MDRLKWWQRAVIYEIAPVSFQDSNGDGKGDLPGLIRRIDYLQWLGVDAVWLTPIYLSPMLDLGYDIADFLRDRSGVRNHAGFRAARGHAACARHARDPRLRAEPYL
jgi:hypothetical protein